MHRYRGLLLVILLFCGRELSARGLLDLLLGRHDLDVITVTDTTPAGKRLAAPSKEHPQYYIAVSLGFRDLGAPIGGIKEPPSQDALRLITTELAKQGYLPATNKSPAPTLVIAYTWGTLNADLDESDPDSPGIVRNRGQILGFLGGRKVGFDNNTFDPLTAPIAGLQTLNYDASQLMDVSHEDFYIIAVSAYDYAAMRQKKKVLLWMTRIAAPSLGLDLGESMSAMLAIAGPHLGRETDHPVWTSASDKFKPNVKLGDIQVIEYLNKSPVQVIDRSENKTKSEPKK